MEELSTEAIKVDGNTQPRAQMNMFTAMEYRDAMKGGAVFPPVVVFFDGAAYWLADGFHRLEAAKMAGRSTIAADVHEGGERDALLYALSANSEHGLRRTNEDKRRAVTIMLNDPEWSTWGDREVARHCRVDNSFVSKLRAALVSVDYQQIRKVRRGDAEYTMDVSNIGRSPSQQLVPEVREALIDTPYVDEPAQLRQLAKIEPAQQPLVAEKLVTGEAKSVVDARRIVSREFMREQPLPEDTFRVLYADPPWQYGNSGLEAYGHAERHYPTMSIEELCALSVRELAADDAVLFLWVTSPQLEEAFRVVRAWGFEYKTSFVWDKVRQNFGYYGQIRHEYLLICTRGSCLPDGEKPKDSVFEIERTAVHSQKPDEFRELINKMYPRGKRIELFAREAHDGWEVWGNQV